MLDPRALLQELIALPGPPGQEETVREAVEAHAIRLGCATAVDPRGNLLIAAPGLAEVPDRARTVVMAHLDEIGLIVERIDAEGRLSVAALGGLFPWKLGEGPVTILAPGEPLPGILSFGNIHSTWAGNPAVRARDTALTWLDARIFTGLSPADLALLGVGPGTRVVAGLQTRSLTQVGDYYAGRFLDDRADLAAMLLAIESLAQNQTTLPGTVFAATVSEEVGGHGALYLLRRLQPEIGIALEIGPRVAENPALFNSQPTVWVNDGYSAMSARDIDLVRLAADDGGFVPHYQALSRGGSDASCASSLGLLARFFTLAFLAENSHGYEITHQDSITSLAALTVKLLKRLDQEL